MTQKFWKYYDEIEKYKKTNANTNNNKNITSPVTNETNEENNGTATTTKTTTTVGDDGEIKEPPFKKRKIMAKEQSQQLPDTARATAITSIATQPIPIISTRINDKINNEKSLSWSTMESDDTNDTNDTNNTIDALSQSNSSVQERVSTNEINMFSNNAYANTDATGATSGLPCAHGLAGPPPNFHITQSVSTVSQDNNGNTTSSDNRNTNNFNSNTNLNNLNNINNMNNLNSLAINKNLSNTNNGLINMSLSATNLTNSSHPFRTLVDLPFSNVSNTNISSQNYNGIAVATAINGATIDTITRTTTAGATPGSIRSEDFYYSTTLNGNYSNNNNHARMQTQTQTPQRVVSTMAPIISLI